MHEAHSDTAGPRRSGEHLAAWTVGIFLFALLVRAVVLRQLVASDDFNYALGDGRTYQLLARRIASGDWTWAEALGQSPAYPFFVAALFRLVGESLLVVRAAQAVLGAASCVLLAQAAWRLHSRQAGIVAGVLLALHPIAVFSDLTIHTSGIEIFLVCWALGLVADLRQGRGMGSSLVLGLVVGALVLTRASGFVFLLVLLPWLLFASDPSVGLRRARAGLFTVGALVALVPVVALDSSAHGDLRLLRTPASFHFNMGNAASSDGAYTPPIRSVFIDRPVARELGHEPSRSEVARFYRQRALDRIRSDPAGWLGLLVRKAGLVVNTVEPADTQEVHIHARFASILEVLADTLRFGLLLPIAFLGAWVTWIERRDLRLLHALVAVHLLGGVVFYQYGRYRASLLPVLLILAAIGIVRARAFLRSRSAPAVAACVAATVAVAVVSNWPLVDARALRSIAHYNLGTSLADLGLEERAILQLEDALALDEDNALAHNNLGALLARRRRTGVAIVHFREAIRILPENADAYFNLGRALAATYQPEAAIQSYREGLALEPGRVEAYVELARLHADAGRTGQAVQWLRRALRVDPGNPEARAMLSALVGTEAQGAASGSP